MSTQTYKVLEISNDGVNLVDSDLVFSNHRDINYYPKEGYTMFLIHTDGSPIWNDRPPYGMEDNCAEYTKYIVNNWPKRRRKTWYRYNKIVIACSKYGQYNESLQAYSSIVHSSMCATDPLIIDLVFRRIGEDLKQEIIKGLISVE